MDKCGKTDVKLQKTIFTDITKAVISAILERKTLHLQPRRCWRSDSHPKTYVRTTTFYGILDRNNIGPDGGARRNLATQIFNKFTNTIGVVWILIQ